MEEIKSKKPHVLAVGVPAQGHLKPLMKLCRQIARHGIKVTFLNIQSVHEKIVAAAQLSGEEEDEEDNLILASILDPRSLEDRTDKFDMESLRRALPGPLTEFIQRINSSNPDEKITCVITDLTFEWIAEIAEKMGAETFGFSPASAASMAMVLHIPKLLEEGLLDPDGNMKKGEIISLAEDIPAWEEDELGWSFPSNRRVQKMFFESGTKRAFHETIKRFKWVLINSCHELESSGCDLYPSYLPVGPLLEKWSSRSCSSAGSLYPEDASCLGWLDSKPPGSVIYVSFGSTSVFSQQQLDELAFGLELSGRAFLWVVRPDLANSLHGVFWDDFLERVSEVGKIVGWAPQEKVLSHPSIACFLSHCGWNSTLEGLSLGVPFLCWPYFADQFHNQKYICDKWETGLRICCDENGIRSRHEIRKKIGMMFSDDSLKANALAYKDMCVKSVEEGGLLTRILKHSRIISGPLQLVFELKCFLALVLSCCFS